MVLRMKISNIKRSEIYYAALDPTIDIEIQKTRPVVVVSPDQRDKLIPRLFATRSFICQIFILSEAWSAPRFF